MRRRVMLAIIIIAALFILRGFFMPWAQVNASVTKIAGSVTDKAGKELKDVPFTEKLAKNLSKATDAIGNLGDIEVKTAVSGYDIPRLVNSKSSKVAIAVAQLFFGNVKDLDKKSYLVYLLPICSIVCILLAILGIRLKASIIAMLALSGIISFGGLFKIFTTNLSSLYVNIMIARGLWDTLYAYLFIFLISIVWVVLGYKESK